MPALHPFRTAVLALALGLPTRPLAAAITGQEVLARARQAHGGDAWDAVQTLVATAAFFLDGDDESVPGKILEDLPRGRYLRTYGAGQDQICWSYDGTRFWYRIDGAAPFAVAGPLRGQVARACAYMHARGYWFPERFPAAVEYLGLAGEDSDPSHVVRVTQAGALPLECRVDARTWLIRRVAWPMQRGLWCHAFSDYRTVQGLLLPFRICCGWEKSGCQTLIQVERYAQREDFPEGTFRCQEPARTEAGPCP